MANPNSNKTFSFKLVMSAHTKSEFSISLMMFAINRVPPIFNSFQLFNLTKCPLLLIFLIASSINSPQCEGSEP